MAKRNRNEIKACPFCSKRVRFSYPWNDPECGPATYNCTSCVWNDAQAIEPLTQAEMADEEAMGDMLECTRPGCDCRFFE